ncbi:MAG TPA: HD domain-containing protein [Fimbriimonas sp.]
MLQKAIEAAARLHSGQYRDGDDPLPYCTHPFEVLLILRHEGKVVDEAMLCAAALHDTIEESGADPEELERDFGPRTRDLVVELTREEPGEDRTRGLTKDEVWQLRSEMLLSEIREMSTDAQTVKLADRLANLRDARRTKKGDKLERYRRQTVEILGCIPHSVNPGLWEAIQRELRT